MLGANSNGSVTALCDWKKWGAFISTEYRLQVGAYYLAPYVFDKVTGQLMDKPSVTHALVCWVGEQGVQPKLVMDRNALGVAAEQFRHALSLYQYIREHDPFVKKEEGRYDHPLISHAKLVSATQVLKHVIAKPGLLNWYAKMAKEGKSPTEERDKAAATGSLIHKNVMFYLQNKPVDLTDAPNWLRTTMSNFALWGTKNRLEPLLVEQTVFHPDLGYAGTLDGILRLSSSVTQPQEVLA